jgi:alginate O-acetyltransferase complex protein AlgJ
VKRRSAIAAAASCALAAFAADPAPGIVGKDHWLFYRYEFADPGALADSRTSAQLIGKLARVLEHNGIPVVVTLVPLKARIYARHLPGNLKVTPYLAGQYQELAKALRSQGVRLVDLDTVFLAKRDADAPLFFRLDTHWSPTGALTAAEAIRDALEADPELKAVLDAVPAQKSTIAWNESPSPANDLVQQLPKGSPAFAPERARSFIFERGTAVSASLLDDAASPAITLMGSSYSASWTLFPDALRFALQRDLLAVSVPANQGSWVGMESYLRDDAFQTRPPKLIVWELPERDMRAPPNFRYREARYVMDNTEWLLRAAAWVPAKCEPAKTAIKAMRGKLAEPGPAAEGDYVEIAFDRPFDKLDYLSLRLTTHGSTSVKVEPLGGGAAPRRFAVAVAGDDAPHAFRIPLYTVFKGYDRVRLHPGTAHLFKIEDAQVCRQMAGLLG